MTFFPKLRFATYAHRSQHLVSRLRKLGDMADIERVAIHIYHERQESGSALCAQHALNSLLQGSYFTASDLSTIAESLDTLEQHVDQGRLGQASDNMDDTGFFSIQVLENALNVWGESLIRWRSESMKSYHDHPQNQRAFVLNCDQHWFTLRRFGVSDGVGPWFNLDSSLERPEWVSETYLGVLLQQAEADGYSTFVVVPMDPDYPLPQSEADVVASSLPSPSSFEAQYPPTARSPRSSAVLENEDFNLQAALHASLDGPPMFSMPLPRVGPVASGSGAISSGGTMPFQPSSQRPAPPPIPHPNTRPTDQPMENPVAASMARNQVVLERMRREQEFALREHGGAPRLGFVGPSNRSYPGAGRSHMEDEEEQVRRAIAESQAMARGQGPIEADSDAAGTGVGSENTQLGEWTQERMDGRVYDDEDADLQAALQASLTAAPAGAHTPDTTTTGPPRAYPVRRSPPTSRSIAGRPHAESTAEAEDDDDDDESYSDDDGDDTATEETLSGAEDPPPQVANEDLTVEEMRRRRLARFGGS